MNLFKIFSRTSEKYSSHKSLPKKNFLQTIKKYITNHTKIDEQILENIEEILLSADIGIETTQKILDNIQKNSPKGWENTKIALKKELTVLLKDTLSEKIINNTNTPHTPHVILVVGVNGVGKTTTIAKIAAKLKEKKIIIGAADTFRAAAVEQIQIWGEKLAIPVIANTKTKDPKAIVYDTIQYGLKKSSDIIIIDTAGRLHNNYNLMQELSGIKTTIQKLIPQAPHETLLVLDSTTGNNAFTQTAMFQQKLPISSIVMTKLDGSAKGGMMIGICDQYKIPIQYVGLGENEKDLQFFDKKKFIDSLFDSI